MAHLYANQFKLQKIQTLLHSYRYYNGVPKKSSLAFCFVLGRIKYYKIAFRLKRRIVVLTFCSKRTFSYSEKYRTYKNWSVHLYTSTNENENCKTYHNCPIYFPKNLIFLGFRFYERGIKLGERVERDFEMLKRDTNTETTKIN